ncbi:hypothetical protein PVAG01_01202 [Phlyctema vagabunda]|uniref:C2H2-type domain-containing protein n=1 Tax=Phlyctema vagabunda TaxID=108571 RepID=A0ABR4PWF5_9HELO
MDIPQRGARPSLGLPEIYVHESNSVDRYRTSSRSSSFNSASSPGISAIPMSIPNAREPVPPPLPPPRHIADFGGPDIAWKWGNSQEDGGWGKPVPVPPGSSLYGSFAGRGNSISEERPDNRRGSSTSTIKSISTVADMRDNYPRIDEGYASLSGTSIGSNKSKYHDSRGFQSSVHEQFRSNAQAYDKSLLQKLDSRRGSEDITPPRGGYSKSAFSSSASDVSPTSRIALEHRHPTLKPLSMPINTRRSGLEDPMARWASSETPLSSAISPANPFPRFGQYDHRSPSDTTAESSPHLYARRSGSGSGMSMLDDASSVTSRSRESYYQRSPETDVDFQMEEAGLTRLQIDDYSTRNDSYSPGSAAGQKRRASEDPPREDGPSLHTVGSASDLFRRRESAGGRTSPSPRYHSTSGSVSSTASGPRNNSYASTLSLTASSITSLGSYGRLSPGGISPGSSDMAPDSPYVTSLSLNPSPRGSISRTTHNRALSETRPLMTSRKLSEGMGHMKHNSAPKMHGVFICECCPKKPKKFDTHEELMTHEQEKQYECAYCHNRFKNKNEAERHQNSLHLRKHSWSCAALSGYEAAFHPSPMRPNEADTCGYCGEDFPRSGISSPSTPQIGVATNQDWEIRIGHLQEEHKFGECNQAKKFFRADHFRQHLKHSHAGTSGKWTNMLENSCMKDEPLPEPISRPERSGIGMSRLNKNSVPVSPGGMGMSPRVGRIDEEEIL